MRNLTRWNENERNPLSILNEMEKDMQRLMEGFSSNSVPTTFGDFTPEVDIEEDENAYLVSCDLPGINKEDINLEFKDNRLHVSGERKKETEGKNGRYERSYGRFERVLGFPTAVNEDKIEASFDNGVLSIALPKEEQEKPQKISIGEQKSGGLLGRFKKKKKEDKKDIEVA